MRIFNSLFLIISLLFFSIYSFGQRVPGQKPELRFDRYNRSPGPKGPVVPGDTLGEINFQGFLSSERFHAGTRILSYVSGNVQENTFPANLIFMTGTPYPQSRMTILDNGRVGIGTSSPIFDLHTVGNTHTTGDFYGRLHFDNNGSLDASPNSYLEEAYFEFHNRSGFGANLPDSEGVIDGGGLLTLAPGNSSNAHQLFFEDGGIFHRQEVNNLNSWANPWYKLLTSEDINGTPNRIAKFTAPSSLGDSQLWDDGTQIGIGTDSPTLGFLLDISGSTRIDGNALVTSDFEVNGNAVLDQTLNVGDATTIGGELTVGSNAEVVGDFEVVGDARLNQMLEVGGQVGIGTATPSEELTIRNATEPGIRLERGTANMNLLLGADDNFYLRSNGDDLMVVKSDGTVAIGTTMTPPAFGDYTLFVEGGILTEEIRVRTGWADHVFEKTYKLLSLEEVDQFIQENGHLPDMLSAEEVEKDGLELRKNAVDQQIKIEELYLHLIEMNKELKALRAENEQLKRQLERLD